MKVSLTKNKEYIVVDKATELELKQLQISFRKRIKNHWVNPKVKMGVWDGYFKFIENDKFIPAGLWKELLNICEKFRHPINKSFVNNLIDTDVNREDIEEFFDSYFKDSKIKPRDYQLEAVYKFVRYRRLVSEIATSAGKTLIIFMIYTYLKHLHKEQDKPFKMLMVVPNVSLVIQGFHDFQGYSEVGDLKIMMVSGDNSDHKKQNLDDFDFVIGTYQSLVKKRDKFYKNFDAVMVDECHIMGAKSLKTIISKMDGTRYKMGLSGTTGIGDHAEGYTIQQYLGPLLYKITPMELIEGNYATPVHVKIFHLDYTSMKNKEAIAELSKRKDFDKAKLLSMEKDLAIHDPRRLNFVIKLIEKASNNSLVLFSSVDKGYGKTLHETLRGRMNDMEVLYVDGQTNTDIREAYKEKMEKNENIVLIASFGTFSTGISIKNIHNVFLVESYKSEKIIKQSIGRGMRLLDGKSRVNIIDIVDDFRITSKSKANYLYKHGKLRKEIYKQEGYPVKSYKFNLSKNNGPNKVSGKTELRKTQKTNRRIF